jgi:hypothetical protein
MLMVRNLCQLALLFSVQDHKQGVCHFIFYLYFNDLYKFIDPGSGKAANAFRLLASKAAILLWRLPPHPASRESRQIDTRQKRLCLIHPAQSREPDT